MKIRKFLKKSKAEAERLRQEYDKFVAVREAKELERLRRERIKLEGIERRRKIHIEEQKRIQELRQATKRRPLLGGPKYHLF